jgi:hypothetical protein
VIDHKGSEMRRFSQDMLQDAATTNEWGFIGHAVTFARVPSPHCRTLNDLDAELMRKEPSPENVIQLCDRLLRNLEAHFQIEESASAIYDLDRIEPAVRVEVEQCLDTHRDVLSLATQLLRRAREGKRDLRWQRQLNRDCRSLRIMLNAQQRREFELVRQTYRLDVKESD